MPGLCNDDLLYLYVMFFISIINLCTDEGNYMGVLTAICNLDRIHSIVEDE